jgi:hypothetical protein
LDALAEFFNLEDAERAVGRRLYERGYCQEEVVELFRLIDWLLKLPEDLEVEFQAELTEYEGQKRMPYITSIERMSLTRPTKADRKAWSKASHGRGKRPTGRPAGGQVAGGA